MTSEKQQAYQGFRMVTVVVPLNPHNTMKGRQRNMKMHYLMRLRLYRFLLGCYYYRLAPQKNAALRHGALCFRIMRQFKTEALLEQNWLTELTTALQGEELCPCVYVYDDGGVGDARHLATVRVSSHADIPEAPPISAAAIQDGTGMDPANVPYFARQILVNAAKRPVEDIHPTDESYREWFGLSE